VLAACTPDPVEGSGAGGDTGTGTANGGATEDGTTGGSPGSSTSTAGSADATTSSDGTTGAASGATGATGGTDTGGAAGTTGDSTGGTGNPEPPPLVPSDPIAKVLAPGESITIEGLRFDGIAGGVVAVDVAGPGPGSGTTVEIYDNLFVDTAYAIHIEGVETVNVHGNRFEGVGTGARLQNCGNNTFEFNEVDRLGLFDTLGTYKSGGYWADNAVQVVEGGGGALEINGNIIDNSGLDGISVNYTEDFISIYHSAAGPTGHATGNRVRGHATSGSNSGGCIVLDQASDNIRIEGNICVNTNQYGIGSASSANVQIIDNQVFLSWEHDAGIDDHPYNSGGSQVVGILTSTFGSGTCANVQIEGNWAVAQRANGAGDAYAYDFNFWNGGCNSTELSFVNNNFTENDSNGGPNPPPPGFGPDILAQDMFAGLDERYFSGRRTTW